MLMVVPERHNEKFQMAEGGEPTPVKEPHTDEPLGPMGVVNICQAAHHQQLIKDMLEDFQCRIDEGLVKDIFKQLIEEMRSIISRVYKPINQADILMILWATPNPSCTALREVSKKSEQYLEDIMPDEEIPPGKKVSAKVSQIKPIIYNWKDMLVSLFDDLSMAHERLSQAAGISVYTYWLFASILVDLWITGFLGRRPGKI